MSDYDLTTKPILKRCSGGDNCADPCGPHLPLTSFNKCKTLPDGLQGYCRACQKRYATQYALDHPKPKKPYHKFTHEERLARQREHVRQERLKNPEHFRALTRRYAAAHSEQIMAQRRRSREENPEKAKEKSDQARKRRRAREYALPRTLTDADWKYALDYFGHRCAVCSRPAGDGYILVPDHWIPLVSPDCPGKVPTNIVPLCEGKGGCNTTKGTRDAAEWLIDYFGETSAAWALDRINAYFEKVKGK